ncbi:MAG: M23 family metallopeptidase [Deltaproteobacteria bacterium]|nr:M23 family metallopeptidase [Deltaproteobacteria bacterium]
MDRTQIICLSPDGSGKVRSFLVSPSIIRILMILVVLCIGAVPLLERGVISLAAQVTALQEKRRDLESEILTLHYVRRSLTRIQEREMRLRDYFGIEESGSLAEIAGIGGEPSSRADGKRLEQGPWQRRTSFGDRHEAISGAGDPHLATKLLKLHSSVEALTGLKAEQADAWNRTPSILPVRLKATRITSGFGWRTNPFTQKKEFHAGIDILGPRGTEIIAPADGEVLKTGYDRWLGNYLVLQHRGRIRTLYGHLQEVFVRRDREVKRGDALGIMGNTGLSTSRHLHYGITVNNRAVDPMQYILEGGG